MAQFKCKLSGTIVNFEYEHDIKTMLKHPQYEFVEPKVQAKAPEGLVKEKTVAVKSIFKD
jgi:hypothetical protein